MGKRINYQKLRWHFYYKTIELASALGVCRSAVKYWVHHGLEPINRGSHGWIFFGKDVIEYFKARNKKFHIGEGEVNCLSCRKGRTVEPNSIELVVSGDKLGSNKIAQIFIKGICETCGSNGVRLSSENKVEEFLSNYPTIIKTVMAKLNKQLQEYRILGSLSQLPNGAK